MTGPTIRVGMIGAGTVGGALAQMLSDRGRHAMMDDAAGARLELVAVAVRHPTRARAGIDAAIVSGSALELARRTDIDVVVEVAGGVEGILEAVTAALDRGTPVVTANKVLMASHGSALIDRAAAHDTDLFYEAAVAGGVPIVRALRTSLAGERIERVLGIVNGTTNYILSQMTEHGNTFSDALLDAQALGYAEADPTADVSGADAGAKVAILAWLAFGTPLVGDPVSVEGIDEITADDVAFARSRGYVIKLLGVAERIGEDSVSRRVHAALVPSTHPLGAVSGATNAVFVEGAHAGPLMWLGPGAGGAPTASAVLGDLVVAARNLSVGRHDAPLSVDATLREHPIGAVCSAVYVAVEVADRPGVLAEVAQAFGEEGVSIRTMEQTGVGDGARLGFLTHAAPGAAVEATRLRLAQLPAVHHVGPAVRVLGSS
jgi:homoserine dehydrogenase